MRQPATSIADGLGCDDGGRRVGIWRVHRGLQRTDGRRVSVGEFHTFLWQQVEPRFESFTVLRAEGVWRAIHRPAVIIEVLEESATVASRVHEVAIAYKQLFRQDAVLVAKSEVSTAIL